ncbi:MAG: hypothetical protein C0497_11210 [Gemmatimonas sp.]|nr:hypothetical protein [Gemmatimonas sp.]
MPPRALAFFLLIVAGLLGLGATGCSTADAPGRDTAAADSLARARTDSMTRVRQDSINRARPGYIVDSILPIEEEIRRFRIAVGGAPASRLTGGAASQDALVAALAQAISANDSIALRRLAVTAREFIDLVYPESPYTRPPYRQAPGLLWRQIQMPSGSGVRRLVERHGGRPFHVEQLHCPSSPEVQGNNRLYVGCTVRFVSGTDAAREGRLFGSIIERHGQFKFVSFANMY